MKLRIKSCKIKIKSRELNLLKLKIKSFPIDLLSFDSEYDKHKFRGAYSNNQPEHHPTAAPMTQVSIRTQIKKSITNGWLNNKKGVVTDPKLKQEIKD